MAEVIGIGASVWDTLLVASRFPEEDGKLVLDDIKTQGGGPTATALVAAARLGARTAFMGSVGADEPGALMERDLKNYGVSTEFLTRPAGTTSSVAYILVNQGENTRTIMHRRGSAPAPELNEAQVRALKACRVLHVEGLHGETALRAARIVRRAGGKVSLDAGSVHPGMENLMGETDLLVASRVFVRRFTGLDDEAAGMQVLYERYHPEVLVVTQGERGGMWRCKGGEGRYPAFAVNVADTTGAGDVFHGAFVYGYLQGWPVERIVRFASAVSALKCTRVGGRAGIPTLEEAEAFLREREGEG